MSAKSRKNARDRTARARIDRSRADSLANRTPEDILTAEPMTRGYRPRLPVFGMSDGAAANPFLPRMLMDVELMIAHPYVSMPLEIYQGGISSVEFKVKASSAEVAQFVQEEITRFWQRGLGHAQRAYEYGWCGCEVNYRVDDGKLRFDSLETFHPRDTRPLVNNHAYVGIQVTSVDGAQGPVNLWGPMEPHEQWWSYADQGSLDIGRGSPVPAKAFWYGFRKRFNRYYGFSLLYQAWRPWKRLAGRDGAEEIADGAVYRYGYGGAIGRYPMETVRNKDGSASPSGAARERMREMLEDEKAGMIVAMPSVMDEHGNYKWTIERPKSVLDVSGLIAYHEHLKKGIAWGIGVPPELMEASEVGSGYSGRAIPLEGYLTTQHKHAREITYEWKWQIADPLILWNFGPEAWFDIDVKSILETRLKQGQQAQQGQGQPGQPQPGGAPPGQGAPGMPGQGGPPPAGGGGAGQPGGMQAPGGRPPALQFSLLDVAHGGGGRLGPVTVGFNSYGDVTVPLALTGAARRDGPTLLSTSHGIELSTGGWVRTNSHGNLGKWINSASGEVRYQNSQPHGEAAAGPTAPTPEPGKVAEAPAIRWGEILTKEADHVRCVGPTHSGKSTLAQAIAAHSDGMLYIIDPTWQPGNWGGLPAATVDPETGDYEPIRRAIRGLLAEMRRRGRELQSGKTTFERLTVVFDEVPDTVAEVREAGELIRRMAQRGRHGNMHLVGMGQSDRVQAWGIAGFGDTEENFCTVYLGSKALAEIPELVGQPGLPGVLAWQGKKYPIDMSHLKEMAATPIDPARLFRLPEEDVAQERRDDEHAAAELSTWHLQEEGPRHGKIWVNSRGVTYHGPHPPESPGRQVAGSPYGRMGSASAESSKKASQGSSGEHSDALKAEIARLAPGSQMAPETREKLKQLNMVGSFPPAGLVEAGPFKGQPAVAEIRIADLSRGTDALRYEWLMSWDQKTKSGRISKQYRYTKEFHERNEVEKHERVAAISPRIHIIMNGFAAKMADAALPQKAREAAAIASIIRETGLRPTDGDESVKHGHFGIASLQVRHVEIVGDEVRLDFIGKEGIRNLAVIRGPANIAFIKQAVQGRAADDFLFQKANSDDAGDIFKDLSVAAGGAVDVKIKDLRTLKAHELAREAVASFQGPPPPLTGDKKKDIRLIQKAILQMSAQVAKVLCNKPTEARDTYIHPEIFQKWQSNLQAGA